MSLESGQKLGPYEILSPAGAGGMGEVYKARDTRLDRIVAIKILPDKLRTQPQLVARFEQEARAISRLNHPNICTLYDVGHEGDTYFLVMEFLEGESLTDLLSRGTLGVPEALDIAAQIADALDTAHRKKLIHRDLKPGNIILTKTGPKLLDFGLAKLERADGVVEGVSGVTQTTPLTGEGTIIGTIQYMSPEQLEGKEADERSDIFAFGSTLYEMITGQRAFKGGSQASLIAAILEREPEPVSQLKPMTPPGLDRLVKKCLAKNPENRWQSVRDLGDELRWILQSGSQAGTPAVVTRRRRVRFRLAWTIAFVAMLAALLFGALWFTRSQPAPRVRRLVVDLSEGFAWADRPRISPNGRYLVFKGEDTTGTVGLWMRPLNSLEPTLVPNTAKAGRPFWSPDSRYFAYSDNSTQLKKVPVAGGPAQLIGEFKHVADGSWGRNGIILVDGATGDSIRQISASGGSPAAATKINHEAGESFHAWPQMLPDGEHFFYLAVMDSSGSGNQFLVKVGKLGSDEEKSFFTVDSRIEYCPPGYLLYVLNKTLVARPFNADALEFTGEPIPVAGNVSVTGSLGSASFSVSDEGTLVISRALSVVPSQLVWVDRDGRRLGPEGEPGNYGDVSLSPDGALLAYTVLDPELRTYDIWIRDLQRKVSSRLTFGQAQELLPIWDRGGTYLYYSAGNIPAMSIRRKAADGSGAEETFMPQIKDASVIFDQSPADGSYCIGIFTSGDIDLYLAKSKDSDKLTPVVTSPRWDFNGTFSPDGEYLAYCSAEAGKPQVYVRKLDGSGGRWQVSTEGSPEVHWRSDGSELFFETIAGDVKAVPVDLKGGFKLGVARKLFSFKKVSRPYTNRSFAPANDGQRFLINEGVRTVREAGFIVIQDWNKEIEQQ